MFWCDRDKDSFQNNSIRYILLISDFRYATTKGNKILEQNLQNTLFKFLCFDQFELINIFEYSSISSKTDGWKEREREEMELNQ